MQVRTIALLAGGAALLVLLLAILGLPGGRDPTPLRPTAFALTSAAIVLPADDQALPAGPNADLVNAQCTACHSASMVLTQPALSAEQWTATVTKMREAYHAPIAERDVPAIIAYLTDLSARLPAPPSGRAQDPAPNAAPRLSSGEGGVLASGQR